MDPSTLLAELRSLGVRLSVRDERLRYEAPSGVMSPDLVAAMREHKAGLLELLGRERLEPRTERDRPVPASLAQTRFWFLARFDRSAVFNLVLVERFTRLDLGALERSLREVVRRHEILRSTIVEIDGEPYQRTDVAPPFEIEHRTAAGDTADERRASAHALMVREVAIPLDLEVGPVFRAVLIDGGDDEHVLGMIIHHAAFDGESSALLARELSTLYDAFRQGRPSPLPELPIQYADYAAFERSWGESEASQRQLAYWRASLAGAPTLTLPTDRPRPALKGTRSAHVPVVVSSEIADELERLARAARVTPAMILLAAYYVVLGRWAGQDDLVVGAVVAGRDRPELEALIGPLVNNIALRVSLTGAPSFAALLSRVKETSLSGYANQQVPFERVVDALNPPRDPSRTPLFQVAFNFVQTDEPAPPSAGAERPNQGAAAAQAQARAEGDASAAGGGGGRWRFDLYCQLRRTADRQMAGTLEYDTDLFERTTIERFASHLTTLLAAAVRSPSAPISTLPSMTDSERHEVIVEWNRTEAPFPAERCLHELVEAQVRRTPDARALVFEDAAWTYDELNRRANRVARWLSSVGVRRGVFVGVYMERSLELVASLLAILKAGAAYVPIDPEYPSERVRYMLEDARTGVILTQARLRATLEVEAEVLAVDEAWGSLPADDTDLGSTATPGDVAYMIYTSGSTGRPKGARNAHSGIVNRLWWMQERYRLDATDRVLQKTPFSFDVSVWEFFWPLIAGAELVVARPAGHRDPSYLTETIRAHAITTLHFVPSMLRIFVNEPRWAECTSVRRVICSGEALPADLAEEFLAGSSAELHNLYGPTEAAVDVTSWECRRGELTVPIGRPISNVSMYVLDGDLEPLPVGLTGEMFIGGVGVGLGYHGRPALTASCFIPDPFSKRPGARLYRTGDHGRWRADGALEYVGRIDGQVKVRGFRIELGEIESALRKLDGIDDVAVIVREDSAGGQRIVGYVVASGVAPSADALKGALKASLPDYMVPNAFVVLKELPLSPSGKVDRRALPAPDFSAAAAVYVPPRTPIEETIAGIWRAVLATPRVGIHDDFFRLGGHSLLVMKIVGRLRDALERDVPVRAVFESSTVAELARWLSSTDAAEQSPPPIARAEVEGGSVLSYCQDVIAAFERDRAPSGTWTTPLKLRIRGPLDRAALVAAVERLLERHESLRLDLDFKSARPPRLHRPEDFRVRHVDMRGSREEEIQAFCAERTSAPLSGQLITFDLLERGDDDHVLMIAYHQIVHDPTAESILANDLLELYAAIVQGREPQLEPLALRYVDYAVWRKRWYEQGPGQAEVVAARARLEGARGLALPTDRPRSGPVSPACITVPCRIDPSAARRFFELCHSASVTPFMGFGAVTAVFLARWSGQEEIAFLTPVNLRGLVPDIQGMAGRFLNFTAISLSLSGDPTVEELLKRARAATLSAYAYSMAPAQLVFGTPLIYDHPVLRVLLNTPEVNVGPAGDGAPLRPVDYGGIVAGSEYVPIPSGARNDLAIVLGGSEHGMYGGVRGATDLFDPETIRKKAVELASVVGALEPGLRLSSLQIAS